jgi:TonB family protein
VKALYLSVLFAFAVVLGADANAQQRSYAGTSEIFFPAFATESERYARDVYLELVRAQPQMIDKKYERHRRNAIAEVSFTVGKGGQVQSLKVARSSGDPELDRIIVSTVQSTRFTPPPEGVKSDFLLPLRFTLN